MPLRIASALAACAAALLVVPVAGAAVDPAEYGAVVEAVQAVDASIAAPPDSPERDLVVGTSRNQDTTLAMAAHSGPNGEDPRGNGVAIAPSTRTHFDVTCVDVAGNLAAVGVVVTRSNLLPPGTELLVFVRDTTLPGGMGDGHNVIVLAAASCVGSALVAATVPPHDHGNWIVSDGLALP